MAAGVRTVGAEQAGIWLLLRTLGTVSAMALLAHMMRLTPRTLAAFNTNYVLFHVGFNVEAILRQSKDGNRVMQRTKMMQWRPWSRAITCVAAAARDRSSCNTF